MNVATNVGRYFLNVINKHFPPHPKFSKIFNRNNMKTICNCINQSKCSLNNKFLSNSILYKANITSTTENYRNKTYYGISDTKFKSRYVNH